MVKHAKSPEYARALVITSLFGLAGCNGVLDPRGPVSASENLILADALAIMLLIVVPTMIAIFGFAWWFRSANTRAAYWPDWEFSGHLELLTWAVPALVITFLGGIAWFGSHALDPFKPLTSRSKEVNIEVVSLDWKWLFIYPGDGIATVNHLVVPAGVPLHFTLTSSGVMNSFFVPQLGSQIYTMAGMTSQVSLQADKPGIFPGLSAQFSGRGFPGMRFDMRAVPAKDYFAWLDAQKKKGRVLDAKALSDLMKPGTDVTPIVYRGVDPELFGAIVHGAENAVFGDLAHASVMPASLPHKGS